MVFGALIIKLKNGVLYQNPVQSLKQHLNLYCVIKIGQFERIKRYMSNIDKVNNLSPVWQQRFYFQIEEDNNQNESKVQIWDWQDQNVENQFLAEGTFFIQDIIKQTPRKLDIPLGQNGSSIKIGSVTIEFEFKPNMLINQINEEQKYAQKIILTPEQANKPKQQLLYHPQANQLKYQQIQQQPLVYSQIVMQPPPQQQVQSQSQYYSVIPQLQSQNSLPQEKQFVQQLSQHLQYQSQPLQQIKQQQYVIQPPKQPIIQQQPQQQQPVYTSVMYQQPQQQQQHQLTLKQSQPPQLLSSQQQKILQVIPIQADIISAHEDHGVIQPYCIVKIGQNVFSTEVDFTHNTSPQWQQNKFEHIYQNENFAEFELSNQDANNEFTVLGIGFMDLKYIQTYKSCLYKINLILGEQVIGTLTISFEWKTVPQQPQLQQFQNVVASDYPLIQQQQQQTQQHQPQNIAQLLQDIQQYQNNQQPIQEQKIEEMPISQENSFKPEQVEQVKLQNKDYLNGDQQYQQPEAFDLRDFQQQLNQNTNNLLNGGDDNYDQNFNHNYQIKVIPPSHKSSVIDDHATSDVYSKKQSSQKNNNNQQYY